MTPPSLPPVRFSLSYTFVVTAVTLGFCVSPEPPPHVISFFLLMLAFSTWLL